MELILKLGNITKDLADCGNINIRFMNTADLEDKDYFIRNFHLMGKNLFVPENSKDEVDWSLEKSRNDTTSQ